MKDSCQAEGAEGCDKAYDSDELREPLDQRGTKPVNANLRNRKRRFGLTNASKRLRRALRLLSTR
jgi:hypothetical protein